METDSLRQMRQRAEEVWQRVLNLRISIRDKLAPLELEHAQLLAAIRAMEAVTLPENPPMLLANGTKATQSALAHHARAAHPGVQGLTMKQLVDKALCEHLADGATANQLLEFFARYWGRDDITRTSLSPQLSRLKAEGRIVRDGKIWRRVHRRTTTQFDDLLGGDDPQNENEPDSGDAAGPDATLSGGTNATEGLDQPIAHPASTS